jgi:hypothetical protein
MKTPISVAHYDRAVRGTREISLKNGADFSKFL